MNLKSSFKIDKSPFEISFEDKLFFIGSCFSQNISDKLIERKFSCLSNPLGIVYNPISIFNNLDYIINQKKYSETDVFCHQEVWSSFDFHSDMSALSAEEVLKKIDSNLKSSLIFLKKAQVVFVTFGSAWVYEKTIYQNETKLVANCHKIPNNLFTKRCLSVAEIVDKAKNTIAQLKSINKDIQIVFTLSPVRHLKDGFIENNLSKSVLNLAINSLVSSISNCSYFAAYELVMDDLRDYRFFKNDLVHPNELAISYVFDQFVDAYFGDSSIIKLKQVEQVLSMLQHKINFKQTKAYEQFKEQILEKMKSLEAQGLNYSEEISLFLN